MPQSSPRRSLSGETTLAAMGVATASIEAWLGDNERSGLARRSASRECLRDNTLQRVQAVLGHELPAAANRRWLCDTVRAWAPLEVLFPSPASFRTSGVTGELARHLALIVEREYGHVAAGLRSVARASDLLKADSQRLALELEIGAGLRAVLEEDAAAEDWLRPFMEMSLAMAEYLHRHVIGLSQVLSDSLVMRYATGISRTQQTLRAACRRPPETVAH